MFVEYIVKSDEPFSEVYDVIVFGIIEVEDELDKGEMRCCEKYAVTEFTDGTIRLYLSGVSPNWLPGAVYERMLRDKFREDGCELELVAAVATS